MFSLECSSPELIFIEVVQISTETEVKMSGAWLPSFPSLSALLPPFLHSFPSFVGGRGMGVEVGEGWERVQTCRSF